MSKVKISISVSRDLLARVDEAARRGATNRSAVIEERLRRADRSRAHGILREETIRYYDSLDAGAREDDRAISRAAARHAQEIRYDD